MQLNTWSGRRSRGEAMEEQYRLRERERNKGKPRSS